MILRDNVVIFRTREGHPYTAQLRSFEIEPLDTVRVAYLDNDDYKTDNIIMSAYFSPIGALWHDILVGIQNTYHGFCPSQRTLSALHLSQARLVLRRPLKD